MEVAGKKWALLDSRRRRNPYKAVLGEGATIFTRPKS